MFKFDMDIKNNNALFINNDNNKIVIVDTYDNKIFNVRYGSMFKSERVFTIYNPKSSKKLNKYLYEIIKIIENKE